MWMFACAQKVYNKSSRLKFLSFFISDGTNSQAVLLWYLCSQICLHNTGELSDVDEQRNKVVDLGRQIWIKISYISW